ncbi:MAG TPA: MXAN_5187 C-terminal domain-containing protein [Kofleriaceae bacterium]|nr:MXAN_5187 C-terminal domain-containing protein [Kofleriaceae bacterium]
MSRALIGGIVAAIIAALTLTAYFVTTSRLEAQIEGDVTTRVAKAQELLIQNGSLEGLGLLKRVEVISQDGAFVRALSADRRGAAADIANLAFRKVRQGLGRGEPRPDIMALTDKTGQLVALLDVPNPVPDQWIDNGKVKYPPLALALEKGQITTQVLDLDRGLMKVGVAPVTDYSVGEVVGAVVIAYSLGSEEARRQYELLGAHVAYFYGDTVHATSFGTKDGSPTQAALAAPLFEGGLAESARKDGLAEVRKVDLAGESYLVTAGRLPRFSNQPLPADYPPYEAGAMVMMSLSDATAPLATVKLAILLLGLAGIIVGLFAVWITARSILVPLGEIEMGVADIVNGNNDRTFQPAGSDLDGLANSLNVMLARLLGRPEPGEEEFDEHGNIVGARKPISEADASTADAAAMKLASEPEEAYLARLFSEFVEAKNQAGDDTSALVLDSFTKNLKHSETELKKKYACTAVRFKVVTKDGKVTLKPVPIA